MNEKTVIAAVTILALASLLLQDNTEIVSVVAGGLIGYLRGKEA